MFETYFPTQEGARNSRCPYRRIGLATLPKKGRGAQIDLLIDRRDFVVNICEMKYSESEFVIDKGYALELENKRDVFKQETGTKKSLFLTLVTTFGVKENDYFTKLVQNSVTMDALFD